MSRSESTPFTLHPVDIRGWIRNIETHANENVNKLLAGTKCDLTDKKVKLDYWSFFFFFFLSFFFLDFQNNRFY